MKTAFVAMCGFTWSSGTIDSEMNEIEKPNHIELINYIYRMDVTDDNPNPVVFNSDDFGSEKESVIQVLRECYLFSVVMFLFRASGIAILDDLKINRCTKILEMTFGQVPENNESLCAALLSQRFEDILSDLEYKKLEGATASKDMHNFLSHRRKNSNIERFFGVSPDIKDKLYRVLHDEIKSYGLPTIIKSYGLPTINQEDDHIDAIKSYGLPTIDEKDDHIAIKYRDLYPDLYRGCRFKQNRKHKLNFVKYAYNLFKSNAYKFLSLQDCVPIKSAKEAIKITHKTSSYMNTRKTYTYPLFTSDRYKLLLPFVRHLLISERYNLFSPKLMKVST